jgi:hypothetical protein
MSEAGSAPRPEFAPQDRADDPMSTLIPYKNGKALAAYYCGVFGLIPCAGAILGPIALLLGIQGLNFAKANPGAKGKAHAIVGIVLGTLATLANWGLILMLLLSLLLAALSPNS